jgi:hypothetical protein
MTALERLRNSDAWDERWDLPVAKSGNNPWIYLGYAEMVLRLHGENLTSHRLTHFYAECTVEPGLIKRFPGSTIPTSHDEVMGAASLRWGYAIEIYNYVLKTGGNYDSHGISPFGRFNILRMPWLKAYLEARAGFNPSPWDKAFWIGRLLVGAILDRNGSKKGPRPRLMNWLMASAMRRFPSCYLAWLIYRWSITSWGNTLKHDLEQEPAWPVLAELATEEYAHP